MKKIVLVAVLLACSASAFGQSISTISADDALPQDCTSSHAIQLGTMAAQDAIGAQDVSLSAYPDAAPVKSTNPKAMPAITCVFGIQYPNPEHLPVLARPLFYHSTIKTLVQIMLVAERSTGHTVAYQVSIEGPHESQGLMKRGTFPTAYAKAYVSQQEEMTEQADRRAADLECASPVVRNAAKSAALEFFKVHDVAVTIGPATDTMGNDLNSSNMCLFSIGVGNLNARDFTAVISNGGVILSPWTGGTDNGGW